MIVKINTIFCVDIQTSLSKFYRKTEMKIENKMKDERKRNGATVEMQCSEIAIAVVERISWDHRHYHCHYIAITTTTTIIIIIKIVENPLKRTLILYILCLHSISSTSNFLFRSLFNTSTIRVSLEQFLSKTYVKKDSFVGWIEWIYCGHNMKQSHSLQATK